MQTSSSGRRHALVIGASMAGLACARVLSEHFARVTVLDRDQLPATPLPRGGIPQGQHIHVLRMGGARVLEALFPGFTAEMLAAGAVRYDPSMNRSSFQDGAWQLQRNLGLDAYSLTRPLLEFLVRRRVRALPKVTIRPGCVVTRLTAQGSRITGVVLRNGPGAPDEDCAADIVVDAAGRGSRGRDWLAELGLPVPESSEITIDVRYVTALVRPRAAQSDACVIRDTPRSSRVGLMVPLEDGLWHVTLSGRFGEFALPTREGMDAFAGGLPHPRIAEFLRDAEVVGGPFRFPFPSDIRWHFENVPALAQGELQGWVPVGDSVASMNPAYGQGMSSALLQAELLGSALTRHDGSLAQATARYFQDLGALLDHPWMIAAVGDFAHPRSTGTRPEGLEDAQARTRRAAALAKQDDALHLQYERYLQLLDAPTRLWQALEAGAPA